jgi:hypothetical protein
MVNSFNAYQGKNESHLINQKIMEPKNYSYQRGYAKSVPGTFVAFFKR